MLRSLAVLVVLLISAPSLSAQYASAVQVIPQIADGTSSDGSSYTSQIVISRQTGNETQCTIYLVGVPLSRLNGPQQFSFYTSAYSTSTNNGGALATGYGLITCNYAVFVNTVYTYVVNNQIQSMATVFSQGTFTSGIISQWMQLPATRIAIAITNSGGSEVPVTVQLYLPNGTIEEKTLTLPAQTSSAQFIDEMFPGLPSGAMFSTIAITTNVTSAISATGLYYIGPVFTTIPITIFQ